MIQHVSRTKIKSVLKILDDDIQQEKRRELIFMDFLRKKSGVFQTERNLVISKQKEAILSALYTVQGSRGGGGEEVYGQPKVIKPPPLSSVARAPLVGTPRHFVAYLP